MKGHSGKCDFDEYIDVSNFIYFEAELLNNRHYAEWSSLFSEDSIYWVPANAFDVSQTLHVSIIYDTFPRLKERVKRMQSPMFWAQDPPSRTCRVIGNVVINVNPGTEILNVKASFILTELRRNVQNVFSGYYRYQLKKIGENYSIVRKDVLLNNNNEPYYNLTFLF